jgi:hypothetical protein
MMDEVEYEFPDEKEAKLEEQVTEDNEVEETIEVEVEDDTPPEDRNRTPLPKEIVNELEKDELTDYSEKVKARMAQLKKVWHDERREKEAAAREREEALRYAQAIAEENKRLKTTLNTGEKSYIQVSKEAAEHELSLATREYREAYELGDTDKMIEAQKKLNSAQLRLTRVQDYIPQYENALQERENQVYNTPKQPQVPVPDKKALAWQEENDWFGRDEEMTSLALGLHEKLIRTGVTPSSSEYYTSIDKTMRKRFPEYFEDETLEETPSKRTKPSTVVAPATRNTAPKKVRLTESQLKVAKKLGITPEQYAREALKLENSNG